MESQTGRGRAGAAGSAPSAARSTIATEGSAAATPASDRQESSRFAHPTPSTSSESGRVGIAHHPAMRPSPGTRSGACSTGSTGAARPVARLVWSARLRPERPTMDRLLAHPSPRCLLWPRRGLRHAAAARRGSGLRARWSSIRLRSIGNTPLPPSKPRRRLETLRILGRRPSSGRAPHLLTALAPTKPPDGTAATWPRPAPDRRS